MRTDKLKISLAKSVGVFSAFVVVGLSSFIFSQTFFVSNASAHVDLVGTGSTHYNSWKITTTKRFSCRMLGSQISCSGLPDQKVTYDRNKTCGYFVPYMSDPNEFGCNHTNKTTETWEGSTYVVVKREFIQDGHRTGAPHNYEPRPHDHETTTTTSTTVAQTFEDCTRVNAGLLRI